MKTIIKRLTTDRPGVVGVDSVFTEDATVINYDFALEGTVEVLSEQSTIMIPGPMFDRLIEAYLRGRHIKRIEFESGGSP